MFVASVSITQRVYCSDVGFPERGRDGDRWRERVKGEIEESYICWLTIHLGCVKFFCQTDMPVSFPHL
jgi:hypothetical protein